MTILEQLWHGTIHPAKIKKSPYPHHNELLDIADENEKRLLSLLTDEGKELYRKLSELRMELYDTENCDIFIAGFRTGAKLMLEIMTPTETKKGE